jgi:hypothetical protein
MKQLGLDWFGLRQGKVGGCCKRDNKTSGFIRRWKQFNQLASRATQ